VRQHSIRATQSPSRRRGLIVLAATVVVVSTPGCFMHRSKPGATQDTKTITEAEIDSVHALNAFEAVSRLRPLSLTGRGKLSAQPGTPIAMPNVYIDNQLYGDVSVLRAISATTIDSIKLYNASEAQYKFGRGNEAGAIAIFTKH